MDLDESEQMGPEEFREQIEHPLLAEQLRYVMRESSFYQKKFALLDAGFPNSTAFLDVFNSLPFTNKSELLEDQAAYPPYGLLTVPRQINRVRRVHRTSGSTGRPLYIFLTDADCRSTMLAGRRALVSAGVTPQDVIVHCLNYCMWAGGVTDHLSFEATGATVVPFGVGHTQQLIETILNLRATAISCTPSYLARLEVVLQDEFQMEPRDLGLKKGLFGGEGGIQNLATRKGIEDRWGLSAIDANYGMADVLSLFGSECNLKNGLHFHGRGILRLEIIHPDTSELIELGPGVTGEMVLTNLIREAQPLIRYRTGDIVNVLSTERCECGLHSMRFRVIGRSDDMMVIRGVNVFPNGIRSVLSDFSEWLSPEFEAILETPPPHNNLKVRVELLEGLKMDPVELEHRISRAMVERLSFKPLLEFCRYGTIERTEGKRKCVIRKFKH